MFNLIVDQKHQKLLFFLISASTSTKNFMDGSVKLIVKASFMIPRNIIFVFVMVFVLLMVFVSTYNNQIEWLLCCANDPEQKFEFHFDLYLCSNLYFETKKSSNWIVKASFMIPSNTWLIARSKAARGVGGRRRLDNGSQLLKYLYLCFYVYLYLYLYLCESFRHETLLLMKTSLKRGDEEAKKQFQCTQKTCSCICVNVFVSVNVFVCVFVSL